MSFEGSSSAALAEQRVDARGVLAVRRRAGRTRIERLVQEGAAKIRLPESAGDPLEAVLINTAGGLTGGDRLSWTVSVGDEAHAMLTTQACEKLYRSSGGEAASTITLDVGAGASLAWLPQETIQYNGSAFRRTIVANLAPGARCLLVEATLFGRLAMGESVERGLFRDRWRVFSGGHLVHAEDFALGPDVSSRLAGLATTGGATAIATVLALRDDVEDLVDPARAIIGDRGGASAWRIGETGKFLARIIAEDGYGLRRRLVPLLQMLNGSAGLPKVWSI
ncbi:urease accessory protein UreD [Aquibium carbonis]|uniref:Urease accessory protein UreD n=1 Tax=Aquibium carbonis TaxID=2495581 RepID=A0A429YPR3_9HYPH|nr:urease accessory protein UreD [Aquibium carbonis]RST83430.1 urease accessory protein UreD [Aquibium carbonis]